MEVIKIKADIHPDGDVYVEGNDGQMHLVGCLGTSDFGHVPDKYYVKIRKIARIYKR